MIKVHKGREGGGIWFGPMAEHVPPIIAPTGDGDRVKQAKEHLGKALKRYHEALELKPNHLGARLGYTWALEQSGDKAKAISSYRSLVNDAWKEEKELKEPPPGWHPVTTEAAAYLSALLDPAKDKDEIAALQVRIRKVPPWWWPPRPVSPVVVPLRDGLGIKDLVDRSARVTFDADGTGVRKHWTWVTRNAGWLVFDPHGKRSVTSALHLFGAASFGMCWDDGYQALAALDDNDDGVLTGKELEGLGIWQDLNGNGICDPGEVKPLHAWGIVALSCRAERGASLSGCAAYSQTGVTFRGGQKRPTYDILLYPAKGGSEHLLRMPAFSEEGGF
jgi:hypothetical protein